jgi:hypothetical protein
MARKGIKELIKPLFQQFVELCTMLIKEELPYRMATPVGFNNIVQFTVILIKKAICTSGIFLIDI